MTGQPLAPEIEECKFLFLGEIQNPRSITRSLSVTVVEANVGDEVFSLPIGSTSIDGIRSLRPDRRSRVFAFYWENYLTYSVRDESYMTENDGNDVESGRLVRVYSKSDFLDYVEHSTWANAAFPNSIIHVGIWTLTHIIDVAATSLPEIKLVV